MNCLLMKFTRIKSTLICNEETCSFFHPFHGASASLFSLSLSLSHQQCTVTQELFLKMNCISNCNAECLFFFPSFRSPPDFIIFNDWIALSTELHSNYSTASLHIFLWPTPQKAVTLCVYELGSYSSSLDSILPLIDDDDDLTHWQLGNELFRRQFNWLT